MSELPESNPDTDATPPRAGLWSTALLVGAALMAAIGALSAAYWLNPAPPELTVAKLYPQPRPIGEFTLTDGAGEQFDRARWSGRWDLVFLGFTHCPDICPNTLNELKAVTSALRARGQQPPRVTFISVDPERDTPERLAQYVGYFDPEFQAATGDHEQLESLTRQLGVLYRIADHEPGEAYGVDHSATLLLIDPDARLRAVFPPPHRVDPIVADLAALIRG